MEGGIAGKLEAVARDLDKQLVGFILMKIRFLTLLAFLSTGLIACDKDAKTTDLLSDQEGVVVQADWKLKPGQWEIRSKTTANGRTVAAPARTICVETPASLSERAISFDDGSGGCQVQVMRQLANKIAYPIVCSATNMTAAISTVLISEDSVQQTIKRKMGKGDKAAVTETVVSYRHLGPCRR